MHFVEPSRHSAARVEQATTVMEQRFLDALAQREAAGRLRNLRPLEPLAAGRVRRGGVELVDLSSNDYLGLARHPLLAERAGEWARELGTGSRASRLVTGTLEAHAAIENRVAAMKGTEAALLFASGWQANAAIFPALLKLVPDAPVFSDWLVHASIHHGIRAARARQLGYRHEDCDHLEQLLVQHNGTEARFIVTESVFSMDGDRADLDRLSRIAQDHDAFLIVDEAHATGVLGPRGAGLTAAMERKPDLVMGTFSKALGSFGAYVAGSRTLIDYLLNACSGFVYTTAPPPPVLGAMDAALDLVPGMDAERAHLAALADRLRDGLRAAGWDTGPSSTQIVPLIVGGERETLALSARLEEAGLLATAIRPPTVPDGSSRIRIALSSAHGEEDVAHLLGVLGRR